jgi:hypothetical protein
MTLIEECPECGSYVSIPDGSDDTFVTSTEICSKCRSRVRDEIFDNGFAEYERDLFGHER